MNKHENVEMSSCSNVKSIVIYVEVGEFIILKSTLGSQLNGNPTLSNNRLTRMKASILYIKPKLLTLQIMILCKILVVIVECVF